VYCPYCRHPDSRVIDSRTAEDGAAIRRRRSCQQCSRRFTTQEIVLLMVGKRSGTTEPFSRDKIVTGVRRACQGRPVTEDQLAILAQQVEDTIRSAGSGEVPSHEVGLAILGPLRELDEVAYLRFASVYRGFQSLTDFEAEIAALRADRLAGWHPSEADLERLSGGEVPQSPAPPGAGRGPAATSTATADTPDVPDVPGSPRQQHLSAR
jgi:transcriptional repressor NrdR